MVDENDDNDDDDDDDDDDEVGNFSATPFMLTALSFVDSALEKDWALTVLEYIAAAPAAATAGAVSATAEEAAAVVVAVVVTSEAASAAASAATVETFPEIGVVTPENEDDEGLPSLTPGRA